MGGLTRKIRRDKERAETKLGVKVMKLYPETCKDEKLFAQKFKELKEQYSFIGR